MTDIDQVRVLRMGVLPPYAYDDDDDASNPLDEYVNFYRTMNHTEIREIVAHYVDTVQAYAANNNTEAFQALLDARRAFIQVLPFTADELRYPVEQNYLEYLAKVYSRASTNPQFIQILLRFKEHMNGVLDSLGEQ